MLAEKLQEAAGNSADATLYVDDVFSTWLYTGNGSTQTITNGIDLAGKGGLVWTKSRSAATDHKLTDTVRGATKALISSTTAAETTDTTGLTAFNSTGFSLGASSVYNTNAATYVSWTFRKAAKFFDVVTWTGNGVSGRQIAHSLGIAPGMMIIKSFGGGGFSWTVYNISLGKNKNLILNTTAAVDYPVYDWPSEPTATTITLGSTVGVNNGAEQYVAYLFAHDTSSTGVIQCGSYTGNGSATGPVVTLGWEPQYLMIKNATGTGNWQVIDSMRGMPVGSADATLQANLANAESSVDYLSPTATGFQITSTSTEVNTSGSTYIYMAIRRPNKPPTTGTQVFGLNARTGTGANATVTGSQTDDAVLIKNRGSAIGDLFASRLTGTGYLVTSSTATEVAAGTTILQANPWDVMDGVKVGTTSTITNASANTFINYLFKRAPGFFDVVCYTGTGSGVALNHNLTVIPQLAIYKARSAVSNWFGTYIINPLGGANTAITALSLNSTSAATNFNASNFGAGGFTSTTFPSTGAFDYTGNNIPFDSGVTYVAYLFATLAGISKVGSYTGNGSTGQAIACGFSAGARFVLIKRTDAAGAWYTFDSARGLTSGSSPYLLLNSTAAEVTGNNGVYASTGGFTLGSTASTTTNINGASYIYLSVA